MRIRFALLLITTLLAPLAGARADELHDRKVIIDVVSKAFMAGRFDDLDALAEKYLGDAERTGSGVWKLSVFYDAFNGSNFAYQPHDLSLQRLEDQARNWMTDHPRSASAQIVYAMLLVEHAWFRRGNGTAPEVSEQQWEGYRRYLDAARDQLVASYDTAASDPQWYVTMMLIARDESWPDDAFDRLLDEAATKQPYYHDIYNLAILRNLPQWGGNAYKLQTVIENATARMRGQEGNGFIARGNWYLYTFHYRKDFFRESHASWQQMKQGFEELVAQYPDQWNYNNYAKFACIAGDSATVNAVILKMTSIMEEAWDYPGFALHCQVWAKQQSPD